MLLRSFVAMGSVVMSSLWGASAAQSMLPVAEVEEVIYTFEPANNGAGPMWGNASSCIARIDGDVFASGIETLKDVQPLNNVRWMLFKRGAAGWALQQADPTGRTREPCPLGVFPDGRLVLSVNPTLTDLSARNGSAEPQILEFSAADTKAAYTTHLPVWDGTPAFTEHSYRSFSVDGPRREMILFQNIGYTHAEWAFQDAMGTWSARGQLVWPWGAEYEEPEPIRVCYPTVALKDRAVYFCGVSDIVEPNMVWRKAKKEITGQDWDYDFRRLFFCWSPDITKGIFSDWIEVASREKTCGWIFPCDIWVAADGSVHLLWSERALDERLRPTFFPDEKQTHALNYAVLRDGKIVTRRALAIGGEGESSEIPGNGRFQVTEDGRLFVFYYCSGADAQGKGISENRILEILADGTPTPPVRVALEHPFTTFINATVRGGSAPSSVLDVLGHTTDRPGVSYARIELLSPLRADFAFTTRREAEGTRLMLDATPCIATAGDIISWRWDVGGVDLTGKTAEHMLDRGGSVIVALTIEDNTGHRQTATRTVSVPLTPADFGLQQWQRIVRAEAESFVAESGGEIHVRTDKLGASALSLSHWNTQGHWLEWEFEVPQDDDYFLVLRYATPEPATRAFTLDGVPQSALTCDPTGGYGSVSVDAWGTMVFRRPDGQPQTVHLTSGMHRFRLENPDGTGLNLDYLDWIGASAPVGELAATTGLMRVSEPGEAEYLLPLGGVLVPSQIREDGGGYTYILGAHYPGDGIEGGPVSTLRFFEDGKELGPAHAVHKDIRELGKGRFSHWRTGIWFSSSDNSDPRTNGRTYTWRLDPKP